MGGFCLFCFVILFVSLIGVPVLHFSKNAYLKQEIKQEVFVSQCFPSLIVAPIIHLRKT